MGTKSRVVSALGICHDCDKEFDNLNNARKSAYEHSRKTGHTVSVEVGHVFHYNGTAKE